MKKNKVLFATVIMSFVLSACSFGGGNQSRTASSANSSISASASTDSLSEQMPKSVSNIEFANAGIEMSTVKNTGIDELDLDDGVQYKKIGTDLVSISKNNCSAADANKIVAQISSKYTLFSDLEGKVKTVPTQIKDGEEYSLSAHYLNSEKKLCLICIQYTNTENKGTYNLQIQMQKQNQ